MIAATMDITRLLGRRHHMTPTGIDRFELQYAGWAASRGLRFVETGPSGPIRIDGGRATQLIVTLGERWSGAGLSLPQGRLLETILAAIDGKISWRDAHPGPGKAQARKIQAWSRVATKSVRALFPFDMAATSSFVHVSHTNLDRPRAFSWLEKQRPLGVFYVHDLIPLTHPEFVRQGEPLKHLRRMDTVLRHADLVLCNSQATARSFRTFAEWSERKAPEIAIIPPGVEACFRQARRDGGAKAGHPYFLMVGTLEPRKNHMLLLQIWRSLVERLGSSAPRLVLVGKRGWENDLVFAILDRSPRLRDAVIEVPDLGDAALAELMVGAAAVLSPSFVEGYGMPIAEALAVGTPVIASDIASHREIAAGRATFLDPADGPGWHDAIDAHMRHPRRNPPHVATHWPEHFQILEQSMGAHRQATP